MRENRTMVCTRDKVGAERDFGGESASARSRNLIYDGKSGFREGCEL